MLLELRQRYTKLRNLPLYTLRILKTKDLNKQLATLASHFNKNSDGKVHYFQDKLSNPRF